VMPVVVWAQAPSNDVTFRVPVRLSQVSPDIAYVNVECSVASDAIPIGPRGASNTLSVVDGRADAVVTVRVSIPPLDIAAGRTATYQCRLAGRSTAINVTRAFSENDPRPEFRLSPTPAPITGSFDWVEAPTANAPPPPASTTSPGGNP
jgi:hypothetical protein